MSRRVILTISLLLVAVNMALMASRGAIGKSAGDMLFGLLLCLFQAVPILLLSLGRIHQRVPKTVITLSVIEAVLLLWLVVNIYFVPSGSTEAIALFSVPLYLILFNAAVIAVAYFFGRWSADDQSG